MSTTQRGMLVDDGIGVRFKISASWVAVLLLFAYGDILGFFVPGRIQEVVGGEVSGMKITDAFLFAVSVYVAVAALMVVASLILAPRVARVGNVVLAILYIASIAASAVGESGYFVFLS